MRSFKTLSLVAAALMASTAMVQAADLIPPPTYADPPEIVPQAVGGWYIRGDIGYAHMDVQGVRYYQGAFLTGEFEQHELDSTWMLQGGIGYQATDYLRIDATLGYYGSASFDGDSAPAGSACNGGFGNFCDYNDDSELDSALLLMANAYVDLGTYNGFTPYAGLGIGGAHVSWGNLLNDQTCTGSADDVACSATDFNHAGASEWRFAWAIHAGASYDVNCRTKIDGGYTYTRIEGGNMFGSGVPVGGGAPVGGNGYDGGIDMHTVHAGLRYSLDDSGCRTYAPEPPQVVYK